MTNIIPVRQLNEIGRIQSGAGFPIKYQGELKGDYPFYKVGDMNSFGNELYMGEANNYITEEVRKKLGAKIIPSNSIIFPKVGGAILTNKKRLTSAECCIDNNVMSISINRKFCLVKYFLYFFNTIDLFDLSNKAALPSITQSTLNELLIPLPPLPEQQRIVAILDEAFNAIAKAKANAEQNLQNAKELFDNYLHSIYTNTGMGWETKKLSEIAEYFNGLTYSPKDVAEKGIIVLRSSNVQENELDFSDIVRVNLSVKERIIVQEGDILMCSRNGSKRLVGKTATIENLEETMTFGTFMMVVRGKYNPYLKWFFKSSEFRKQISIGENTMINQITRYMLDDVTLSFPSPDEQEYIVGKLDALSAETKKLEVIYQRKINDLEELKKSVLQRAFSGELNTTKELVLV